MDSIFPANPTPADLGGQQNGVLYSMMKVIYRQSDADAAPATAAAAVAEAAPAYVPRVAGKVARLSCCCRISELLPLVKQLHDEAREQRLSREVQRVAA